MDKLVKRYKNEIVKDDPVIITLEEGRDFHCTRRERAPAIEGDVLPMKTHNEWTWLGCYILLGYFMHWSGWLIASDMIAMGLWTMLAGFLLEMFVESALGFRWRYNWIIEWGLVLFGIGLCALHLIPFYGLLAITITCLSIKIRKR